MKDTVFSGCTIDSKAEKFNYGRAWNNTPRCAYINTTLLQPERLNENRWTLTGLVPAEDVYRIYAGLREEYAIDGRREMCIRDRPAGRPCDHRPVCTGRRVRNTDEPS